MDEITHKLWRCKEDLVLAHVIRQCPYYLLVVSRHQCNVIQLRMSVIIPWWSCVRDLSYFRKYDCICEKLQVFSSLKFFFKLYDFKWQCTLRLLHCLNQEFQKSPCFLMLMLTQLNALAVIDPSNYVPKKKVRKSVWIFGLIEKKLFQHFLMTCALVRGWMDSTSFRLVVVEMEQICAKLRDIKLYLLGTSMKEDV